VIQTGTIAAVSCLLSLQPPSVSSFSDSNILYEIGDFKLNAAQIVSIFTIVLLSYINSRGVKTSKILQTVLTVIKILSLAGLILWIFLLLRLRFGMLTGQMLGFVVT
jgi:APA family basic amino acid/polyamine antiporter